MRKVFLFSVSLRDAAPISYRSTHPGLPSFSEPMAFPILIQMAAWATPEDEVVACPILIDASAETSRRDPQAPDPMKLVADRNEAVLRAEIAALEERTGIRCAVVPVRIPNDETIAAHYALMRRICGLVRPEDRVFSDMTFSTKPTSLVLATALHYLNRRWDTRIEFVSYCPKSDFRAPTPGIAAAEERETGDLYDVTPLYLINAMTTNLAKSGRKNPEAVLRDLFKDR